MADGYLRIKTKVDNSEVSAEMSQLQKELATAERSADLLYQKFNRLNKQLSSFPHWKTDTSEYGRLVEQVNRSEIAFERAGDKASKLKDKLKQATDTQMLKSVGSINDGVNKMGSSIGGTIKKVLRWGVAIFGVRSAYMGIRSIINTISGYNQQIKTDLDYMKYTMAMAFQPIVEKIVKGFYALLQLINEISIKLFNFNLFGKGSVNNFNKMAKGAKEIKKSLAGFDEMNVLGDQSTSGQPSVDLSKETNILKGFFDFLKSVSDLVNKTISFWEDEWTKYFGFFNNEWDVAFVGALVILKGFYDTFKGIIDFIVGLVVFVVGIFIGNMDVIKEGLKLMADGLISIVKGLFEIIIGLVTLAIGIVLGLLVGLLKLIYNFVIKPIADFFVGLWNGMINGAKNAWDGIKSVFSAVGQFFSDVFSKAWNGVKNIFSSGGKIFDGIKDGIVNAFKAIVNTLIKGINFVVALPFKAINGMLNTIRSTNILGVEPFKKLWDKNPIGVPQIPKLATGGIVNRPTRAIIGEAGPERVIPLSQDAEWISKVADAFASKNGSGTVNVYLDGRLIQKQMTQRTEELSFAKNR